MCGNGKKEVKMADYRIIKNKDADEVLSILREYVNVLCKAEKEFMKSIEKDKDKLGGMFDLIVVPIQRLNDMRIKNVQKAIDIMTFGSEK